MHRRTTIVRIAVTAAAAVGVFVGSVSPASAHEGEESVPAITDVQEAIAILAEHPGLFPEQDVIDHAMDKVRDSQESEETQGVDLNLVKQAQDALEAAQSDQALTLLERSIGSCPGAPVIEPQDAPRKPPPLDSPCPSVAHILALDRSAVSGTQEPVLIVIGAVLILAGLGLVRRIR